MAVGVTLYAIGRREVAREAPAAGQGQTGAPAVVGGNGQDGRELPTIREQAGREIGGVPAALLDTTAASRNSMFRQTLQIAGYECPDTPEAHTIGDDGMVWRVDCGGTLTYRIEVDGSGRLRASPMPYGDVNPPVATPAIEGGRTLELRQSEPQQ